MARSIHEGRLDECKRLGVPSELVCAYVKAHKSGDERAERKAMASILAWIERRQESVDRNAPCPEPRRQSYE